MHLISSMQDSQFFQLGQHINVYEIQMILFMRVLLAYSCISTFVCLEFPLRNNLSRIKYNMSLNVSFSLLMFIFSCQQKHFYKKMGGSKRGKKTLKNLLSEKEVMGPIYRMQLCVFFPLGSTENVLLIKFLRT